MGMASPIYYTAEMVRALPDDGHRYETVHGELLVTPAPRAWHQIVLGRLYNELMNYLKAAPIGLVLASPADISWGPDVLVQPDLFVADLDEARTLEWSAIQRLLLAVEVLSPSSTRADRFTKRRLYQEQWIPLYWVVDGDAHVVEVWTPDTQFPRFEHERLVWHPAGADQPFTMTLPDLFRPL
jgi:Uma2 family endonuclease